MKYGDTYDHFKGGEYMFHHIALPANDKNLRPNIRRDFVYAEQAKYHDGSRNVKLFTYGGVTFIDADVPHVIYQSTENKKFVYAREVDDFFGQKINENGEAVQRFVKRKQ